MRLFLESYQFSYSLCGDTNISYFLDIQSWTNGEIETRITKLEIKEDLFTTIYRGNINDEKLEYLLQNNENRIIHIKEYI